MVKSSLLEIKKGLEPLTIKPSLKIHVQTVLDTSVDTVLDYHHHCKYHRRPLLERSATA
jgi:hypothetical protein